MKILKNPKSPILILLFSLIVFIALIGWFYVKSSKQNLVNEGCNQARMEKFLLEKPLPKFDLVDFNGKDAYPTIADGSVLLIFMRTNCGACQDEMKLLSDNSNRINKDLKIIGIAADSKEEIGKFTENFNLQFPIFLDQNADVFSEKRITCTPTHFLLESGTVKNVRIGGFESIEDLEAFYEKTNSIFSYDTIFSMFKR